jgi:hypothetical protein
VLPTFSVGFDLLGRQTVDRLHPPPILSDLRRTQTLNPPLYTRRPGKSPGRSASTIYYFNFYGYYSVYLSNKLSVYLTRNIFKFQYCSQWR